MIYKNPRRAEVLFIVIFFLILVFSMAFFLTKKNLENQKNTTSIEAALINSNKNENSTQEILNQNQDSSKQSLSTAAELASGAKQEVIGLVRKNIRKDNFTTYYLQDYDSGENKFLGNSQKPTSICLSSDSAVELKLFYLQSGIQKTENMVFGSAELFIKNAALSEIALSECKGYERQINFRLPANDYQLLTLRNLQDTDLSVKINFASNALAPSQGEIISVTSSTDNITQNKKTFRFYPQILAPGLMVRF